MKPQQEVSTGYQGDFFRTELPRMVNPKHPMVKVAAGMDWEAFEMRLPPFSDHGSAFLRWNLPCPSSVL